MCLRDHGGNFILAKTMSFNPQLCVKEGEAMGLLSCLRWLHELELDFVVIETDAKLVVDCLNSDAEDTTEFGSLITACRTILLNKPGFKVGFIKRQANEVAHTLARAAPLNACTRVFSYLPNCISSLIINEML